MLIAYLAAGLVITYLLHHALGYLARADARLLSRSARLAVVVLLCAVFALLIRSGFITFAGIYAFSLTMAALLIRLLPLVNAYRRTNMPPPSSGGAMSKKRARAILGVSETATAEEIQAAYHRLMQKLHPDQGGTDYLAAELNAARDRLLKQRKSS